MQELIHYLNRIASYDWWVLLVEWVLIGSVVYAVLRFVRGTRGARLLKGAALVLFVAYVVINLVAGRLGLERLRFLYGYFLVGLLFSLAIVFQPELRRGLMRIGETRLFRGWARQVNVMVDKLVTTAGYLSENKIGALIAVERDVGLGGLAESGVRLDAELSPDLLTTIFWPGSALHDMGVVVQQGRVLAAGVQFPLAESGELPHGLGSRHRAAMGLSLDSDALVIVVSEETGIVSLADRGRLLRCLTPEKLRRHLLLRLAPSLAREQMRAEAEAAAAPAPPPDAPAADGPDGDESIDLSDHDDGKEG